MGTRRAALISASQGVSAYGVKGVPKFTHTQLSISFSIISAERKSFIIRLDLTRQQLRLPADSQGLPSHQVRLY